jgi:SAM-dependent methyltransferase
LTEERLPDLIARLERERAAADRQYNEALTALDRALVAAPAATDAVPAYDDSQVFAINDAWNILPAGAPSVDRSLKGRLRGFIWRLVGPPLEQQRHFNAALVDHLNRNVAGHRDAHAAIAALTSTLASYAEGLMRLQAHLVQYLQTITLYVDTRDRHVLGQLHVLNTGLDAIADDWLKRWESAAAPANRLAAGVRALEEMRATVSLAQQTSVTLKREVERLISAVAGSGAATPALSPSPAAVSPIDVNSFKYLGFEDAFRGSRDEIRARLMDYLPIFDGVSDVLDIGCGRGEFLDLLRERGIPARGIDVNHEMVEASRARGLAVDKADALGHLQSRPDASLGGVFAAQVIEHLAPEYLMQVLDAALLKLRPGGVLVLETINPACWLAFFESYIRDLTHVRPIHPDTLQYLLRASGFASVTIEYRSPVDAATRLQPIRHAPAPGAPDADLVETFNANVERLNARLFTFQDYAAIARR